MTKHLILMVLAVCLALPGAFAADYTTPGTSAAYTLSDMVTLSGGAVTGGPTSFVLAGNLTIAPTDSLTIAAGQSLLAAADPAEIGYALIIRGALNAAGASGNMIRLAGQAANPGEWRGVMIMHASTGPNIINWCEIEDARFGVSVFTSASTEIANSAFENFYGAAIAVGPGATPNIHDNTIQLAALAAGIVMESPAASAAVTSNTLTGGEAGIRSAGAAAGADIQDNNLTNVDYGLISDGSDAASFTGNTVTGGFLGAAAGNTATSEWSQNIISGQSLAGMAIVNTANVTLRGNSFSNSGSLGSLFIDNSSQPDLGTGAEAGLNTFAPGAEWDLVNFSPLLQNAVGNTWSAVPPGDNVFDYYDDTPDVDGNGVTSGRVFFEVSRVNDWMML